MNPEIFKEYDIRGIWKEEFNSFDTEKIAEAFCEIFKPANILIGHDHRFGSEIIARTIEKACQNYCNVISIDLTTTPMFYYAIQKKRPDAAMMVTASHNPKQYNGIKIIGKNLKTIGKGNGLEKIKKLAIEKTKKDEKLLEENYKITKYMVFSDYMKFLSKYAKGIETEFLLDCGNGMGFIDSEIMKRLKLNITPIFEAPNPEFPNHIADPSKQETLKTLQSMAKSEKKIGFALDGDCDRMGLVDEEGEIIQSDKIAALIEDYTISNKDKVILTVNIGKIAKEIAEKKGGLIITKVGRTHVKENMVSNDAKFGAEASGHFYFKNFGYFDSGIFAILTILRIVSNSSKNLHELIKKYQKYNYSEFSVNLQHTDDPERDKEIRNEVMKKIIKKVTSLKPKSINKIDGISAEFKDFWYTIRPSNTEPIIRVNLETKKYADIDSIKKEIRTMIEKITDNDFI